MATVFVARELANLVLVTTQSGIEYRVIPFRDGTALVAWVGNDPTPALLASIPTEEMLLGSNHERAVGIFAKMLREALDEAGLLYRVPGGVNLSVTELVVATREGIWRIDQAFQAHACTYAAIGDGARTAEALFGEFSNSYKESSVGPLMVRSLHFARDFDTRVKGPFRLSIIRLGTQGADTRTFVA